MEMSPYLVFNGNCREAFTFYSGVLGGELSLMTQGEAPLEGQVAADEADLIMHARLQLEGCALLGSDNHAGVTETPQSFAISVSFPTPGDADRAFAGLSEGATVTMPIAETFWALRFGMLTDRFGMPWMVNCDRAMAPAD